MTRRDFLVILVLALVVFVASVGVAAFRGEALLAVVGALSWGLAAFSLGRMHQLMQEHPERFQTDVEEQADFPTIAEAAAKAAQGMEEMGKALTSGTPDRDFPIEVASDEDEGDGMQSTEISMCQECGGLLDDSRDQRGHQGRRVDRCLECAKHGLCTANPMGPHDRVIWPEEPDYDLSQLEDAPRPLPEGTRVGYCPECLQTFWVPPMEVGFRDLGWEDVGVLWAAETDPDLLRPPLRQRARLVHVFTRGATGEVIAEFEDVGGRRYRVADRTPFREDGPMEQVLRVFEVNETRSYLTDAINCEAMLLLRKGEVVGAERVKP